MTTFRIKLTRNEIVSFPEDLRGLSYEDAVTQIDLLTNTGIENGTVGDYAEDWVGLEYANGDQELYEIVDSTFDIQFHDDENSNAKGFEVTFDEAKDYINNNATGSYFDDYKGGTVVIVNNDTGEIVHSQSI